MYMFMAFMVTFFISFGQQNFTAENLFSLTHGNAKMNIKKNSEMRKK